MYLTIVVGRRHTRSRALFAPVSQSSKEDLLDAPDVRQRGRSWLDETQQFVVDRLLLLLLELHC